MPTESGTLTLVRHEWYRATEIDQKATRLQTMVQSGNDEGPSACPPDVPSVPDLDALTTTPTPDLDPDAWSERITRSFVPLTAEPVGQAAFWGNLRQIARGPLRLAKISGSAQHVVRGMAELTRSSEAELYLNVQLDGAGCTQADDRATKTKVGAAVLVSSDTAFSLNFNQEFSQLCVAMPAAWVSDRIDRPLNELTGCQIETLSPIGGIVQAAIAGLVRADGAVEQNVCCDLLAQSLQGAIRSPDSDRSARSPSRLLDRIRRLIRHNFNNHALTPALAAAELGCSLSTLHLHCQNGGESFLSMLQSARLDAAAMELGNRVVHRRDVGAVADACGFNDPSHFARLFRARFGTTPSNYRRNLSD